MLFPGATRRRGQGGGFACSTFLSLLGVLQIRSSVAIDLGDTSAAVDSLMSYWNTSTGRWDIEGPWWHSGIALQAVLDYVLKTGNTTYLPQCRTTVEIQRAPLDWWPEGEGEFRADSTDDTGWWALALATFYELTGESEFLEIARKDEEYMYTYWNTTTCDGGLIWAIPTREYHNAISNELYLELAAKLHNLVPGDEVYLQKALQEWHWFNNTGMINGENLVNDGLTDDAGCVNNGQPVWTYNQGVILGGLVELYKATDDTPLLDTAQAIADAVINSATLSPGGILTENACASADECEPNGTAFKGLFVRGLAKLDAVLDGNPYRDYIQRNAQSAFDNSRNDTDFYGLLWQGPFDADSPGRQVSAVDLLIAATLG